MVDIDMRLLFGDDLAGGDGKRAIDMKAAPIDEGIEYPQRLLVRRQRRQVQVELALDFNVTTAIFRQAARRSGLSCQYTPCGSSPLRGLRGVIPICIISRWPSASLRSAKPRATAALSRPAGSAYASAAP